MTALQVPEASADATEHADWLELAAITAVDSDSSRHDLMRAIKRTGSIDAVPGLEDDDDAPLDSLVEREDDELEQIADAAFEQIELRKAYLGSDYPFAIDGALKAAPGAAASPYAFLTTLTYFGPRIGTTSDKVTSLFERLSATALVQYLGGAATARSYDFGFPRRAPPKSFHAAIEDLCQKMGEGIGCKVPKSKTANVKDAKLDLVVWVPFGDGRPNQLSVFGQCTTARDWQGKLNELQPVNFCNIWLKESPAMSPLSAFFVPRQVVDGDWSEVSVDERRIFFDRLRIARSLGGLDAELAENCAAWTAAAIS